MFLYHLLILSIYQSESALVMYPLDCSIILFKKNLTCLSKPKNRLLLEVNAKKSLTNSFQNLSGPNRMVQIPLFLF